MNYQALRKTVALALTLTAAVAVVADNGIAQQAGQHCTFTEGVRYSQLVIDSRINDFKANNAASGFGVYNSQGQQLAQPVGNKGTLDYVPGLVAKAILEAADYYQNSPDVDVAPWFYAVHNYGMTSDISWGGKLGSSFDDLNAVKLYNRLSMLVQSGKFSAVNASTTQTTVRQRFADALSAFGQANKNYVIKSSTLASAAGGWWHKANYTNQMWCDEMYMGPALLAELINAYDGYKALTANDWNLIALQFDITWNHLWNPSTQLLYHAFTADPAGDAARSWAGVSAQKGAEVYHSAEYWGRACAWYFMALVDVLEQMTIAGLTATDNYKALHGYLQQLAAGIAAKQDPASGCWYQLLNHDATFVATSYPQYSYTTEPVHNYLEASCTAIFTAAYLKGMRLGLFTTDYTALAKRAYRGFVEQFMVGDGQGGVHLIGSCKSAGLGGSSYRDGSAAYYLMGRDTQPTTAEGPNFYTEGKVLGGFIMAATEYERLADKAAAVPAQAWNSETTGSPIAYNVLQPTAGAAKGSDGKPMTVVYLENLGFEKIGQNTNADDVAWLRQQGYQVIELDYAHSAKAVSPALNADINAINASLQGGKFCGATCSSSRSYVLMEGYRLQRDISYYKDDPTVYNYPDNYKSTQGDSLYLDLVYPANPRTAVPVLVTFSYSSSHANSKHQRMFLGYTWGAFKDSFVEGASAVGYAWAVCDHPKYCDWGQGKYTGGANKSLGAIEVNPDAARKVKSAIRTVRGVGRALGLNGVVAVTGFSRGSTSAALAVGDGLNERFEDAARGRFPQESSAVQCAVLGPAMFDYQSALTSSNEYTRMNTYVGANSATTTWEQQGALSTIKGSASAPTLFYYNTDDFFADKNKDPNGLYATQAAKMKARLDALGIETRLLVDYGSAHSVPQKPADLKVMYDFLLSHQTATTGITGVHAAAPCSAAYDLLGRKAGPCTKGFVVRNGRLCVQQAR